MDLINFRVGKKTISLKILDILLTERYEGNLTSLPNENPSFLGVKDYMGTPTPIFDLGLILNNQSSYETNQSLVELLQLREQDHKAWLSELELSVHNDVPFTKSRDPKQTDFGKWFYNFKTDNEDLKAILSRFEGPHDRLHSIADEVLNLCSKGKKDQALATLEKEKLTTFTKLIRLFESARDQIILDHKPIIVFTTEDGQQPHIGLLVDRVEDNIHCDESDIKPLHEMTNVGFDIDPQTKKMMKGLIKQGDNHSLVLDPSAIFRPEHLQDYEPVETEEYGLF
ncbi:chemotaxis protein CheW [Pseudoalteromonas luteoviolacea]|uniref:Methyl-accepting chemotaxis protein n=1 Tax=Pseudoalteromonas luteoviolacea DSM 6061 TaxID=1365250 RepID=A0A166UWQ8_9GAMM|nr:chemotaxis protein CheW [Pseudoalteromonas luteoviolacea]KZN31460.1 methyl-accepting chemotaxis protein [Pseudoalteromonas luteoviolacea DSM 6061]KZN55973.1 methyl-accepting chemotaxis protein [Pseudoalteromonas luteoviolacea CPMOR-2]TQF72799.1 chemotaxis protein [Pseudoalteromonas luteoviolacea]